MEELQIDLPSENSPPLSSAKKRRRSSSAQDEFYVEVGDTLEGVVAAVQAALERKDALHLAATLVAVMGYTSPNNAPTLEVANLMSKATKRLSTASKHATLQRIATQQKNHTRHNYFGLKNPISIDSIGEVISFLDPTEKFMLSSLNRSWKNLISKPFMWPKLDPCPVRCFSKPAEMKQFLTQNSEKFSTCKTLQIPSLPSSVKLFKDIFAAMPQLCQISLHNITGSGSLRHVVAASRPAQLLQLSFGLATKVTPAEVVCALKHFVNLRAVEISFWHSEASFDVLGEAIGSLKSLQYLSMSQSFYYPHGYSLEQDTMNDEVFAQIAKKCVCLRDVHFSSFYAITNATWRAFATHCPNIRSFSIEDCGLCIDKEGAIALTRIAPGVLKNLVILPRYVGNVSSFLPSAGMPYVTDEALPVLNTFRETSRDVMIFTRRDPVRHSSVMFMNYMWPSQSQAGYFGAVPNATAGIRVSQPTMQSVAFAHAQMAPCGELTGIFGVLIDGGTAGESYYRHLVSEGQVAAFRMYMDQHLLPYSYFSNYSAYR